MQMAESAEMYLETIYVLQQRKGFVRSVDIANEMGFSKPTISEWMGKLQDNGYLVKSKENGIVLTEKGIEVAERIYERHTVLTSVFQAMGVSEETAIDDACRVEHYISDETFEAFKRLYRRSAHRRREAAE